ncbi:MAG: methyltransferase family protein [Promethearchaeota archaeon]
MFEYQIIGLFFAINLTIYLAVSLPLDLVTYHRNSKSGRERSDQIDIKPMMIITFLISVYMWLIFLFVPIDALFAFNIIYIANYDFDPWTLIIQIFGFIIVFIATLIASWGRISRGRRAFSWGIPKNLEKKGMYKYIRHPLYASYCYYFLGFVLILQNLLILPLLIGIYGYYNLSKYEEAILIDHFDEEYIDYQNRVGRFFPRLRRRNTT